MVCGCLTFEGSSYAGFCEGEYIGQELACTLVAGKTYQFTMRLAYDDQYFSVMTLGVCTINRGNPGNMQIIGGTSSCSEDEILWTSGVLTSAPESWELYTVTFVPSANYDYIMFKNDEPGSNILVDSITPVIPLPTSVGVNQDVTCNGGNDGSATITVNGGVSFNFDWGDGHIENGVTSSTYSSMSAGTYNVTITDLADTCAGPIHTTVVIAEPTPVVVTANSSMNPICSGDSTTLTASGLTSYTWFPPTGLSSTSGSTVKASPGDTTTYTVTGLDINGCTGTQTITVNTCLSTLPVELTSFSGKNVDGANILEWQVEKETNVNFFTVETSTNNKNWHSVSTLQGRGTASTPKKYYCYDNNFEAGYNYYRLSITNLDGSTEILKTIQIKNNTETDQVVKVMNYLWQEVDENYKGLIIKVYSSGKTEKSFQK